MARTYRQVDDRELALVWTWRAVSLKPGDITLRRDALELALSLGQPEKIIEQLDDLVAQAIPPVDWADLAASALGWLANAAPSSALAMARSLLDIAGPVSRSLRAAALDVARVVGDEAFAWEILERAATARACQAELPELLLALCERYQARGKYDACLSAAVRAAKGGASCAELERFAARSDGGLSADGRLSLLELRRMLALAREDATEIGATTIELAVARAELSLDVDGAVSLWVDLAQRFEGSNWATAARDMAEVLGQKVTAERLEALSHFAVQGRMRPCLRVLAAQVSMEAGDVEGAAASVEAALRLDPTCAFVLPLAEHLLSEVQAFERLESLYSVIEAAVLGVHGVRALHHRAAVSLAESGQYERALGHATVAFETLPEHDASYRLLVELAHRASDPQSIAAVVSRVAESEVDPSRKVEWLRRGYDALPHAAEHLRLKFELALKILLGCPRASAITLVASCLDAASSLEPEELEFMRIRVARALESLLNGLDGPDGARLGVAIAIAAIHELGRVELATTALSAALGADGDVDEFASVVPVLFERTLDATDALRAFLDRAFEWLDRPYVAIGRPAVEMLASVAALLADARGLVRLEARTTTLGHEPWLALWLLKSPALWSSIGRPLALAIALLQEWAEAPRDVAIGLELLELAAKSAARDIGTKNLGEVVADPLWQRWTESYGAGLPSALPLLGLEPLRERLRNLESEIPQVLVVPLRVALERASGDHRALANALADWSFSGVGTAPMRAELLVEAARLLEKCGDFDGSLAYFRAAFGTHRGSVQARLGLASALYRLGRTKTDMQTSMLLELTENLVGSLPEDERDLVVFIRAEALECLGRHGEAQALLRSAEEQLGPRTFIVLGLAEQSLREQDHAAALGYFAAAVGGNLRGMRRHADVSLAAAKTAAYVGEVELALTWLEPCLEDVQSRPEAMSLQAELLGASDAALDAVRELSDDRHEVSGTDAPVLSTGPVVMAKVALTKMAANGKVVAGSPSLSVAEERAERDESASVPSNGASSNDERVADTIVIDIDAHLAARDVAAARSPVAIDDVAAWTQESHVPGASSSAVASRADADWSDVANAEGAERAGAQAGTAAVLRNEPSSLTASMARPSSPLESPPMEFDVGVESRAGFGSVLRANPDGDFTAGDEPLGFAGESGKAAFDEHETALGLDSLDASLARTLDVTAEGEFDGEVAPAMAFESPSSDSPLGAAFQALSADLDGGETFGVDLPEEPIEPAEARVDFEAPERALVGAEPEAPAPVQRSGARSSLSEAFDALELDVPRQPNWENDAGSLAAHVPSGPRASDPSTVVTDVATPVRHPIDAEQGVLPSRDPSSTAAPDDSSRHRVDLVEPSAYEFAIAVAEELSTEPQRQRAWLPDGKRWLRQWPTQVRLVELVRNAVAAEGGFGHAQALGQVLALLRGEYELPVAPDFAEQTVDPEVVRGLLLRDSGSPGAEALELVWDGAEHEFLREPSDYDVTGVMRVVGTASPLARIYGEATRHLGLVRVPLFHRRSAHLGRVQVLLVNPTALLVEGEPVADEDILGYRIGSALWATLPAHSLLFGLEPSYVRSILRALGLAFGTSSGQPNPTYGDSMRLAQVLWQTVRSRSQRRLKEICQSELDFEESWEKASQSLRRAGLYVCGNLRTALRMTVEDAGLPLDPADPTSLVQVALTVPETMDLFRLATSAEYAAMRWQPVRPNPIGGGTRPW
jgi:tetratricopeptide (TPR) repeat protein